MDQHRNVFAVLPGTDTVDNKIIIIEGHMAEPYINKFLIDVTPKQYIDFASHDSDGHQRFTAQVKIPLVMAALLQDIGNYHPDAQRVILGVNGTNDPFATLEVADRKVLLQISYRETVGYLLNGIGGVAYVGNPKADREQFNKDEQNFYYNCHKKK